MKTALKVFGKIVAILLAFILFISELAFIVVDPVIASIKDIKEVVTQIEIKDIVTPSGDEEEYNVFVDNISEVIGVTVQQGKELIETEAVKQAVGEVLQSVVDVMGGDESKKLTKQDFSNLVTETIQKAQEETGLTLPSDLQQKANELLEQFGIDEIYEKINDFMNGVQPTGAINPNNKVLSTNKSTPKVNKASNPAELLPALIGYAASGTIIGALIGTIIVVIGLIFLCQFSIVGGLIETGIVSILAGLPLLFVNSIKNELLYTLSGDNELIAKFLLAFKFDRIVTNSIIFIVIGVIMLGAGIAISIIKKNKKKEIENVVVETKQEEQEQ